MVRYQLVIYSYEMDESNPEKEKEEIQLAIAITPEELEKIRQAILKTFM
ncbi:MAG TPA: hypothetical protein VNX68_03015 [Nitrosopumilaceae archaeon]|jgi:hypothetical protein|nr:hypothetical protein [Nitrosopumilaceae archaeon]